MSAKQPAARSADNLPMKHGNLWPLPIVFRLLDLRVTKKDGGLGLVFEVDVTDGRSVSTWVLGCVSRPNAAGRDR